MKKVRFRSVIVFFLLLLCGCKNDKETVAVNHKETLDKLISQEDTDGDKKITLDDKGPREFEFIDKSGKTTLIKGTYHLSNLLQELAIADKSDTISLDRVTEAPSDRISRLIKTRYWDNLTRSVDKEGLSKVLEDTKSKTDTFR